VGAYTARDNALRLKKAIGYQVIPYEAKFWREKKIW